MNRNRRDRSVPSITAISALREEASIWRCPVCRGGLVASSEVLRCPFCAAAYPCVGNIPDLRLAGASWIDQEQDRTHARRLLAETQGWPVEAVVRQVFAERPGADAAWIELRARQLLEAPRRLRSEVQGWLAPIIGEGEAFLDLGCGGGTLLAAAAAEGRPGIGIDASLVWLVVARRLIAAYGGRAPVLAAALAEALPLADGAVAAVVSLDVIEHVADPAPYLRELDRVTRRGGRIALATPNRFSLTAEPHVFVWGVGWLPRRLQARYVAWRSGKSYAYTRLLSTREAARLVRVNTGFTRCRFVIPPVAEEEIARFAPWRAALARGYNRIVRIKTFRWLLLMVGPFFRLVGAKA